jgi:hypothetical protein
LMAFRVYVVIYIDVSDPDDKGKDKVFCNQWFL